MWDQTYNIWNHRKHCSPEEVTERQWCQICNCRNNESIRLSPKLKVFLLTFIPQKINKEKLYQQLRSLSDLFIITGDCGYIFEPTIPKIKTQSVNTQKRLLAESRTVEEGLRTLGYDSERRLYNQQGEAEKERRHFRGIVSGDNEQRSI